MDRRPHLAGGANRHGTDARTTGEYSLGEKMTVTLAKPSCTSDQKVGMMYSLEEKMRVAEAKPQ